jgi:hypothetical protein
MKKSLLLLTLLANTLQADIDTSVILMDRNAPKSLKEGIHISTPEAFEYNWQFIYELIGADSAVFEWIPEDEKINKWTQVIQVQSFTQPVNGPRASAQVFAKNFITELTQKFPTTKYNFVENTPRSVMIEWCLPQAANGRAAQTEIVRIISTEYGVYRVAYTKKGAPPDNATRADWMQRLASAYVARIGKKH